MGYQFDPKLLSAFNALKKYCEDEKFSGWDPYDGLNSKIFQSTPLRHWVLARLVWIQAFKRNPVNLRSLLLVSKNYNAKGVGLFLSGYCNLYKTEEAGNNSLETKKKLKNQITDLSELLMVLQFKGYSGACWGYNFDWQNRVFFQPKNTPTIVATSFCADALFNAYEITGNKKYLEIALSSANFIVNDLNKINCGENLLFSYSPLDHSQVYNASLLGARLLARCGKYCNNDNYFTLTQRIIKACIEVQNNDGSWYYGAARNQKWIDSFHTGFNLECIWEYMQYTGDLIPQNAFEKGMEFYIGNFFLNNGTPKYYHNKTYPIDIHSPAQLIVTLTKTGMLNSYTELVDNVLEWTIKNMQDQKGFFYYQIKKNISSKIPYMRWAQAWMFYSFTYYLK